MSLLFFIILTVLLAGAVFYDALKPAMKKEVVPYTAEFIVRPGMGMREIARALADQHLIRSSFAFEALSVLTHKTDTFKPGIYAIGPAQSSVEIANLLSKGPQEVEVVIVPGMTLAEVEDVLVMNKVIDEGQLFTVSVDSLRGAYPFLKAATSLEGFLFPDTYRFYPHSDPMIVVDKILDNFRDKIEPLLTGRPVGLRTYKNNDTIHWLILASILEKEVINKTDSQLVAGILEKRLAIGMPLQVDASIIYAKCGRFSSCSSLLRSDFFIDSPYNTYRRKGLPPTPISNPGIDAISAALSSVPSPYLYYLSDPATKQTIFAKTLDEQNAHRNTYLLR